MLDKKKIKQKLEEERDMLLEQMKDLGKMNPKTGEWEVVQDNNQGYRESDQNDMADRFEDFESKSATVDVLENRLNQILFALKNINKSSYGKCVISGEDIEEDRLLANPAATTCKKYMNQ
ncbi:MAG: TraR/DksA family transcriptional regulator [Candidatus Paceibacterota bacterium]